MLAIQSTFDKQVQALLARLQDAEYQEHDLLTRLEICIKACEESLLELRQWVTDNSFPDQASEIYFFKRVKPVIMARYIYYYKIYRLHIGYFHGNGWLRKERLHLVIREIGCFLADNKAFCEYYRTGNVHNDELYFLRGRYDWKICPDTNHFDMVFSTSADGKLAELLAQELFLKYVEQLLNPPADEEKDDAATPASSSLQCTATITEIVELGYALHASGFFNNGKATIKEIMNFLEEVLKVDLGKYYDTFLQIRERKKNVTKFLDRLKAALLQAIDRLSTWQLIIISTSLVKSME